MKMLRLVYTLVFIIALPVIFLRLWIKDKKVPGYRIRWPERFGIFPPIGTHRPLVWVHAVSVGEVVAAAPLVRQLLQADNVSVMVTTTTPTGSTQALTTFGRRVHHVYAPYDLPWTVAAFLRRTHPALVIIMETELWPNILHVCAQQQIPVILANARMSARSARGYRQLTKTTRRLLNQLNHVAVQNEEDGQRFLALGLDPTRLRVTGSVKFDINLSTQMLSDAQTLKQEYGLDGTRLIFIAASTHGGEDTVILDAYEQVAREHPELLLLLVPRHPERFEDVYQLCVQRFQTVRRSHHTLPSASTQVVIGDTMGEMMLLYGSADIAFIGGSLIEHGGHNMIEPACWGLPILCGPHTFNFADISKRLIESDGMVTVRDATDLTQQIRRWLQNPAQRIAVGENARRFTTQNRGATDRLMTLVRQYVP